MAPLLSIGLPVYNGSRHLREAIDSLLAQDVDDLELVISDNASTDDTPAICAEYAGKDSRIRYSRNATNIGAAANFNRAFELCSGTYFMWGSDDDVWDPRFARACLTELERHPAAVLCTSQVVLIDDDGAARPETYRAGSTGGMTVEQRVHDLLSRPLWYDMYSVFKPAALRATGLYAPSFGGDVHLLLELTLLGDFLAVPDTLLKYRIPETQKTPSQQAAEIGVPREQTEQHDEPWGFLARNMVAVITNSDLGLATITRILGDFADTLSQEKSPWGSAIMRERGLPRGVTLPQSARRVEIRNALRGDGSVSALRRSELPRAWSIRPGMRMRSVRHALLRLLQPFVDRQSELDARQGAWLAILAEEVSDLRRHIAELEKRDRRRDSSEDQDGGPALPIGEGSPAPEPNH